MAIDPSHQGTEGDQSQPLPRRGFLRIVSGFGAAVAGFLIGVPVLRAFFSPAAVAPADTTGWIKVADDIALIDIGVPVSAVFIQSKNDAWIESRTQLVVWLYTQDGEKFKAYNGRCTHLGCGFAYDAEQKVFQCPCHRGQFDVKSGAVLGGPPPRALDELAVEIRDSAVWVHYKDYQLGIRDRHEV